MGKTKARRVILEEDTPTWKRIQDLVDAVDTLTRGQTASDPAGVTVGELAGRLPWTKPTMRRILRECEKMGVLARFRGGGRRPTPGRPSDVWRLG